MKIFKKIINGKEVVSYYFIKKDKEITMVSMHVV